MHGRVRPAGRFVPAAGLWGTQTFRL